MALLIVWLQTMLLFEGTLGGGGGGGRGGGDGGGA